MPELPEVETTLRSVTPFLLNQQIVDVEVLRANMVGDPAAFRLSVAKRTVIALKRRGKYMLLTLDNETTLILHLKMSGRLWLRTKSEPALTFERIRFHIGDNRMIIFNDPRTLGRASAIATAAIDHHPALKQLGPEALEISQANFLKRLDRRPTRIIKALLMDQAFVAGMGNIYAQEACYLAKVDPRRRVKSLSLSERKAIYRSMRTALQKGIRNMGTSVSDFSDLFGKPGRNQNDLLVYGRAGKPCKKCKTIIKSCVIAQRTTAWCPECQK